MADLSKDEAFGAGYSAALEELIASIEGMLGGSDEEEEFGMEIQEADKWSGKVKTKWHSKPGVFTGSAKEIANYLWGEDKKKALQRITYYINRAGDNLSNKTNVLAAKKDLEKRKAAEEKKD